MPKTSIPINKEDLQKIISELESVNDYSNKSRLYTAVAETSWAKELGASSQTIANRIKLFNIDCKTQSGKIGVGAGRKPRGKKTISLTIISDLFKVVPKKYHNVVKKIEKGSAKAAIKLKCLDCCCWDKKEVAACHLTNCSLHQFRPYKGVSEDATTS